MDDHGGGAGSASGVDELLGSLLTRFSALGVASSEDDLVTQFALIFSIEKTLARFYLDAGGMNLERSINLYLDNIGVSRAASAPQSAFGFVPVAEGDDVDDAEEAMIDSAIQASLAASRSASEPAHSAAFGGGEFARGSRSEAAATPDAFAVGTAPPSFSFSSPAAVSFGGGTAPPSFSFAEGGAALGARSFVPLALAGSAPMGVTFNAGTWGAPPPPAAERTMEE